MPVELQEGKLLLSGEMFAIIAEVESAAPGGCSGGHDLEALAYTLANRAPVLPQDPDLPRVEHLYRSVGLPLLQETHRLTRRCEQLVWGNFGGLLPYT
jgi:hypothetical protein